MTKNILITGSSGYIGSHFVKHFSKLGHTVFGLDQAPPLDALAPYMYRNCEADISASGCVGPFIKKYQIEYVIHCAALCLVAESVEKPELYQENNVRKSEKFLACLVEHGVKGIVFSSTAATYGEPQFSPITEEHPQLPINPYGQTKLDFEKILLDHEKRGLITVGIMRYFNAAGADPEGELGECHEPETHLIPNACKAVLGKSATMKIFGNDYQTRDGTCERDYIHILDLADAHHKLLEKIQTTGNGGIYNLGLGKGYTINEVLTEIGKQAGKEVPATYAPRRPGDPSVLVASPEKAIHELKWKPKFSDLPTIVKHALGWQKKTDI